jgi:hypothetical protein
LVFQLASVAKLTNHRISAQQQALPVGSNKNRPHAKNDFTTFIDTYFNPCIWTDEL